MSLFNNYNREIKLVYSGSYVNYQGKEFLLNGVPAYVNDYILNKLKDNRFAFQSDIVAELQTENESTTWLAHIAHKNFYNYYKLANGIKNIITVDEIVYDNSIYLYPIEICFTLNSIYADYSIKLNGTEYTYGFIDTIDPKVLLGLQTGNIKLVLNVIHDPLEHSENLLELEKYFNNHGITGENIIVIGGNTFDSHYDVNPNSKLKITNGYIVLNQLADKFHEYPRVGSLGYKSDYVKQEDLDINHIRSKKFICMNRNMHRPHRWLSAYMAFKYNLLNDSIFTFVALHDYANNRDRIYNTIAHVIREDAELESIADSIVANVPMEIDTKHLSSEEKHSFNLNNNNKDLFAESYINIVSETSFEFGGGKFPFISEKTFHHPIINLQPFIVMGNPYTLKTLRDLGFKTFSPLINESYDECTDFRNRFKLINAEISRLSALSLSEIHDIYYQLTDVLIHNQNHAKTFGKYNPFNKTFNDIRKWYLK
jgi:hypothetical protein